MILKEDSIVDHKAKLRNMSVVSISAQHVQKKDRWIEKKSLNFRAAGSMFYVGVSLVFIAILGCIASGTLTRVATLGCIGVFFLPYIGWYCLERFRFKRIPADERSLGETHLALIERVEHFNERLSAIKDYVENADPTKEVDPAIIEKYEAERKDLDEQMRAFMREDALRRFEKAVVRDDDGKYRATRDLSEAIFISRVRVEEAEAKEAGVLTARESPFEEEFRVLDEAEAKAAKN